jgi:hypothetical protein
MIQEFTQQIKTLVADMVSDVHTAIPGKIVSFDPVKCLAIVLPSGKFKRPDGKMMDLPQISDVPVVFIQGGAATVAYPIKAGDGCLLIIAEQALDVWRYGGESKTDLRHDWTNCIAVPGLFVQPNPVIKEACDQDAVIVVKGDKRITVSQAGIVIKGNVRIEGNVDVSGTMGVSGAATVASCAVSGQLSAGGININSHQHAYGSGYTTSGPQ